MISRAVPVSTKRPAYITAMRSEISAATPTSCVTNTIAMPSSRCNWRSSSRIWICTVTSSAVVGSSASSTQGEQDKRQRDHRALAHAAGQSRADSSSAAAPPRGSAPCSSSSSARCIAAASADAFVLDDRLGDLLADRVDRVERRHRLLEDHRRPRRRAASPGPPRASVEHRPARRAGRCPRCARSRRQQAHQRAQGDALAGAGFAQDAQRLAARQTRRLTPFTACTVACRGVTKRTVRSSTCSTGSSIVMTSGMPAPARACRQMAGDEHASRCRPRRPAVPASGGTVSAQIASAKGQRVRKRQPDGGSIGLGGSPVERRLGGAPVADPSTAREANSARV